MSLPAVKVTMTFVLDEDAPRSVDVDSLLCMVHELVAESWADLDWTIGYTPRGADIVAHCANVRVSPTTIPEG